MSGVPGLRFVAGGGGSDEDVEDDDNVRSEIWSTVLGPVANGDCVFKKESTLGGDTGELLADSPAVCGILTVEGRADGAGEGVC